VLFRTFHSQEERRAYGGSAFVELQFCKLPVGTNEKKIVAVSSIDHWQNDSLYIHMNDIELFYREYRSVFGDIDLWGINYYAPAKIQPFIEIIRAKKPADHAVLIDWLHKAKNYNGFYILGI